MCDTFYLFYDDTVLFLFFIYLILSDYKGFRCSMWVYERTQIVFSRTHYHVTGVLVIIIRYDGFVMFLGSFWIHWVLVLGPTTHIDTGYLL